jgi:predicted glycoside hydrolase/deacetylase ChbG (UPF0249 family)
MTQGCPVLPAEQVLSLVNRQGSFYSFQDLIKHLPLVSFDELRQECFAQAELMISSGVPFDHIDFHQGFPAGYEPFFPIVIELARNYQVPVRNPMLGSTYGEIQIKGTNTRWVAVREIARFAVHHPILSITLLPRMTQNSFQRTALALRAASIPTTNWLVEALYENARIETMIAIIEQLPPGISEVACHPGFVDEELRSSGYGYVEQRAVELKILQDPQVKEALRRCQVRLVDFSFLNIENSLSYSD